MDDFAESDEYASPGEPSDPQEVLDKIADIHRRCKVLFKSDNWLEVDTYDIGEKIGFLDDYVYEREERCEIPLPKDGKSYVGHPGASMSISRNGHRLKASSKVVAGPQKVVGAVSTSNALPSVPRTLPQQLDGADDEFDLDSADEAELLNTHAVATQNGVKRKSEEAPGSPSKRPRSEGSAMAISVANAVLRKTFNMPAFRLDQQAAIARILDGGSAVVVFPTGGGKSLCYQVPALCFREMDRVAGIRQGHAESGITLIVSPLIALMKDQVDALERRGISAAVLDSTKTKDEYLATVDSMRNGTLDILYCAPERLNNEGFVGSMANVRGGVRLLAVVEAHCISEWGHAFRPDYLKVARFSKEIGAERVVCLTATATPKVAADVRKAFDVPEEGLFRTPTYRPNLELLAESFRTKKESYPKLISFLKAHPGPSIVYVTLQKHTEELAQDLRNHGFKARHFHAGMTTADKTACQDAFMASDDTIIVATIAFGMGIDKANIRNVVHYDIPRSLEGYSQEIGRAGRDGKQSHCMLYLCAEDLHLKESFARGDLPSKQSVADHLQSVFARKAEMTDRGLAIEGNLYNEAKQYDIKQTVLKNIYAQLELHFGLLRETTAKYTKYSYKTIAAPTNDRSAAAQAIRAVSTKGKTITQVDVDAAARSYGINRPDVVAKLNEWHDRAFIDLQTGGVVNIYRVLQPLPTTKAGRDKIIDELYAGLEEREQTDLDRGQEVMNLINGSACFSRTLAEHFGDGLPDGRGECGHCSWCLTHTPVKVIKPEPKPFDEALFQRVLKAVPERDDARFLARVAFGIGSPRVTAAKLSGSPVYESMAAYDFRVLLKKFTAVCEGRR